MSEVVTVVFPGLMITWILFIAPHAFNDLYQEHSNQTLQRLMLSGASMAMIVLSKAVHCFLICLAAELLLIVVSWLLFGMQWGNLALLFLILLCVSIGMTGLISLIFGLANSRQKADVMIPILVLSLAFIGGGMFPYRELPPFLQELGNLSLVRWGIVAIDANIRQKPMMEIVWPSLQIAGFGLVLSVIGIGLMKRRFETGNVQ